MPREEHLAAAQHHENAAKSHHLAAERCGEGDHDTCKQHAAQALEHSAKAHEASKHADQRSRQHAQPAAAGSA